MWRSRSNKRCRNKQNSWRKASVSSRNTDSSNQDSEERDQQDDNQLELPGFYYDKVKKKYYKIQPEHKNVTAGVITPNTLRQQRAEQQRQNDIQALRNALQATSCSSCVASTSPKKIKTNLLNLVTERCHGDLTANQFQSSVRSTCRSNLRSSAYTKIISAPTSRVDKLWHMQKMYCSESIDNRFVCLWSLKDVLGQRLQAVSIDSIVSKSEDNIDLQLNVSVCDAMIRQDLRNITSMCSAKVDSTSENEYVLYTTTKSEIERNPSMAMIRKLNCTSASDFRYTDFSLGAVATWCCAWNPVLPRCSIGTEKAGLLLDVDRRYLWEYITGECVFAQKFSSNGKLLYSGTRTGSLYVHDVRCNCRAVTHKLNHPEAVYSIRLSSDDYYVYAADYKTIKKWDVRRGKVVTEYRGNQRDYGVEPVNICETDNLLYTVGDDYYTRLWNLQTGDMISCIPPPYDVRQLRKPPVVYYTSQMTHYGSRPGLFMGVKDELHFYSM